MVAGWQKLTIQYYTLLSCLTNILYKGGENHFKNFNNDDFLFSEAHAKFFKQSFFMGCSPPVSHKKPALTGGTAFPGCAGLTCSFDTGWKARATDLNNFSRQFLMVLWPTRKL
jgi:hypothetical protein